VERPQPGTIAFVESQLMYYMPGFNVAGASDEELAMRYGHLVHIRKLERKVK
jgi:hypothetical protein